MADVEIKEEASNMSIINMLREQWKRYAEQPYFYQTFNKDESPNWMRPGCIEDINRQLLEEFYRACSRHSSFEFPIVPVITGEVQPCCYSDLQNITDFKPESMIQTTQPGRLFRGTITDGSEKRAVIVKTWDFLLPFGRPRAFRPLRFCDEIEMYETTSGHRYLAKLFKYCYERRLAVVYDENFSKVLSDVLLADDFGWDKRIKVATQVADLLSWLHEKKIAVGSITASCIMINEEVNIKVFDFGYISNHVDKDSKVPVKCWVGREAPEILKGVWMLKSDVYIFGILLMELISKKEFDEHHSLYDPVVKEEHGEIDLIHECFKNVPPDTKSHITQLTSRCLNFQPDLRPTMKEVFNILEALRMGNGGRKRDRDEDEAK